MTWGPVTLMALVFIVQESLAGIDANLSGELKKKEESQWEYTFSTSTYLVLNGRDYANPTLVADRDWLHLEARYNYEALKTGSIWLGYNLSFGSKLVLEATPMLGGVFGDSTGVAPGYTLSLSYKWVELFTQGEYFFDAATRDGNFFYTWTELSVRPMDWFRLGLVIDRTKAFGSDFDIRRGPFLGLTYKKVDLTTYWLSPGSHNSAVIFAVTVSF